MNSDTNSLMLIPNTSISYNIPSDSNPPDVLSTHQESIASEQADKP